MLTSPSPSLTTSRAQTVVIDARGHMLGRLASIVAKQVLAGHQIVSTAVVLCVGGSKSVLVFCAQWGWWQTSGSSCSRGRGRSVCVLLLLCCFAHSAPSLSSLNSFTQVVVRCEEITISGGLVRQVRVWSGDRQLGLVAAAAAAAAAAARTMRALRLAPAACSGDGGNGGSSGGSSSSSSSRWQASLDLWRSIAAFARATASGDYALQRRLCAATAARSGAARPVVNTLH